MRNDVVGGEGAAIAGGDPEREGLSVKVRVGLPVLAPVSGHGAPSGAGALNPDSVDVTCPTNVGYEHQVEV